jgi:hypothetical protein
MRFHTSSHTIVCFPIFFAIACVRPRKYLYASSVDQFPCVFNHAAMRGLESQHEAYGLVGGIQRIYHGGWVVDGNQVQKVGAVSQSKSSNVWI